MKKILLLLTIFIVFVAFAQRSCGTDNVMNNYYKQFPEKKAYSQELRKYLSDAKNLRKSSRISSVITIPVVVHVLYKDATQNISNSQILSQIEVLNKDFRKQNADFSSVVPLEFQSDAADLELAFCLATKDPNGNATTGIERKSVSSGFTLGNDYYTSSGLVAWDTTKYLNIWVGVMDGVDAKGESWVGTLGFAYLPDSAGQAFDGVVISYDAFGTIGTASAPFNKGRTATHEIGHYFGLNHPWGEAIYGNSPNSNFCGTTGWDDFCADTPATYYPYSGTPTFPDNKYTCTSTTKGAMFMNFMDYVYDSSMAMFSNDQKIITQNTITSLRASLLNSNSCANLNVTEAEKIKKINLYPNPASQFVSVASPLIIVDEIEIFDTSGKLVVSKKNLKTNDQIDVRSLSVGLYYVRLYSKGSLLKSDKFVKK